LLIGISTNSLKAAKAGNNKNLRNCNGCQLGLSSKVCNIIITLKDNEYGNNNSKFVAFASFERRTGVATAINGTRPQQQQQQQPNNSKQTTRRVTNRQLEQTFKSQNICHSPRSLTHIKYIICVSVCVCICVCVCVCIYFVIFIVS